MRLFALAFVAILAACTADAMVGRTCTNAFLGEDVFVVKVDALTYSRVVVRRKDGTTAWMGRNELTNCRR